MRVGTDLPGSQRLDVRCSVIKRKTDVPTQRVSFSLSRWGSAGSTVDMRDLVVVYEVEECHEYVNTPRIIGSEQRQGGWLDRGCDAM